VNCFSWAEDTSIHSFVRQDITDLKEYNIEKIATILENNIQKYWHLRDFKQFNYLDKGDFSFINFIINLVVAIFAYGLIIYIKLKSN
jgi:hypothetical protein